MSASFPVGDILRGRSYRSSITTVLLVGILLRCCLFWFQADRLLQNRPELSTPQTSWRYLQEGLFIARRGRNELQSNTFYASAMYATLFDLILVNSAVTSAITWILADIASACSLLVIFRSHRPAERADDASRKWQVLVPLLYLLHPYTIATCVARSITTCDNAFLLGAIALASTGRSSSILLLSVAASTSIYPILLLPAIILLLRQNKQSNSRHLTFLPIISVLVGVGAVGPASKALAGPGARHGLLKLLLMVPDLTPNSGMFWYFFTEMFDHFRAFFLGVFQLHVAIYALPLYLRLYDDPLLVILTLLGVFCGWKSYPSLGELGLWTSLLACFPDEIASRRHPFFTTAVYLYTAILLPLLHALWLLTGTGNANFFYAATMVHGLNTSLAIVDVLNSGLRYRTRKAVDIVSQGDMTRSGGTLHSLRDRIETEDVMILQLTSVSD